MKKLKMFIPFCVLVIGWMLVPSAQSSTYTFSPIPADLNDLDHGKYYKWKIQSSIPSDEYITGANLFFDNINDWTIENGDIIYIHLLDTTGVGVTSGDDGGGDKFAGQGILLTTYTDDNDLGGWYNPPEDWTYIFTDDQLETFRTYAANNMFGFGIDPDCHFFNDGINFEIITTTTSVPEPASMLLLGSGLIGLAGFARKKFKK